jgi:hypothetical protein
MVSASRPSVVSMLQLALLLSACLLVSAGSFDPISLEDPPYKHVTHPMPLSPYWSPALVERVKAVPTNRWWQNLVLEPPNQPCTASPLALRIETTSMEEVQTHAQEGR